MGAALTIEEKKERVLEKMVRTDTERSTGERKRNSFNGTEGKLAIGYLIKGFHLHIFNDTPGRIDKAIAGGYTFVSPDEVGGTRENVVSRNTDLGDKVRFLAGTADDGRTPLYSYLLKIKDEWYEEDQNAIQAKTHEIDDAIKNGRSAGNTDGTYTPQGGISLRQSNKF